jgi:hypothetical protein
VGHLAVWGGIGCFICCVFVLCGLGSFNPCEFQWYDAPEGSVCQGQALPPCGVESALYAQPQARASQREPGTLCGCFRLVISVRSDGFCGAFGVKCFFECILFLPRCGQITAWLRDVVVVVSCVFSVFIGEGSAIGAPFSFSPAPLQGSLYALTKGRGALLSIISSQNRSLRTVFKPRDGTHGKF